MCGIVLSIRPIIPSHLTGTAHSELPPQDPIFESLVASTSTRGPDVQQTYRHTVTLDHGTLEVKLSASVLGLRGVEVTSQPLINKRGVLAWNGQVKLSPHIDQG
jgi:asparagine synthetase B (glutamine-hydrolysing)